MLSMRMPRPTVPYTAYLLLSQSDVVTVYITTVTIRTASKRECQRSGGRRNMEGGRGVEGDIGVGKQRWSEGDGTAAAAGCHRGNASTSTRPVEYGPGTAQAGP